MSCVDIIHVLLVLLSWTDICVSLQDEDAEVVGLTSDSPSPTSFVKGIRMCVCVCV